MEGVCRGKHCEVMVEEGKGGIEVGLTGWVGEPWNDGRRERGKDESWWERGRTLWRHWSRP